MAQAVASTCARISLPAARPLRARPAHKTEFALVPGLGRRAIVRAQADKRDSYETIESPVRPSIGDVREDKETGFDRVLKSDTANPDRSGLGTEVGVVDAMRFKGAAPEVINSRAAMIGITTALWNWLATGKNIYEQWQSWPNVVLASFVIITIASLVPIVRGAPRYSFGPFKANLEVNIGRLAMFGIVAAMWVPFVYGYQLWPVS